MMHLTNVRPILAHRIARLGAAMSIAACAIQAGCAGHVKHEKQVGTSAYQRRMPSGTAGGTRENIFVLRSIREEHGSTPDGCTRSIAGFEPFASDGERFFSFWSVRVRGVDGRLDNARVARVATLRGCFGPTDDRARQHFYAEITFGSIALTGRGECLALGIDVPEAGLIPVRCQLVLHSSSGAYSGGLLTTNTMSSRASFGDESDPAGYTQASIATIRLWKSR